MSAFKFSAVSAGASLTCFIAVFARGDLMCASELTEYLLLAGLVCGIVAALSLFFAIVRRIGAGAKKGSV